jgi:hypothetical protein
MSAADLERRFLAGLDDAQTAYEEIVATEAWLDLGHESFTSWWEGTVRPAMRALSMRPTREIAAAVVEKVRQEEADLPPAQRRTQRELADLIGAERSSLANRNGSRSAPREESPQADLEPPADPIPPVIAEKIEERIKERAAPEPEPDYSKLDAELDAAMENTAVRFRRNWSAAVVKACQIWSFDVDRLAEVYAADFDADIERGFLAEMERFIDRVREANRRHTSGLRVIKGGRAS